MTDTPPPAVRPAVPPAQLAYATFPPRLHAWRRAAGIAALVLGCGGMLASLGIVWYTLSWTMARNSPTYIPMTVASYVINFLASLAIALFGLALLCRSPRAWHAAIAYFFVQLINPLLAIAIFPFVAPGLWKQATPGSYFMLSGYLSGAAGAVPPLLLLALLTRPLVHEMIDQWSRGDGAAPRRYNSIHDHDLGSIPPHQ